MGLELITSFSRTWLAVIANEPQNGMDDMMSRIIILEFSPSNLLLEAVDTYILILDLLWTYSFLAEVYYKRESALVFLKPVLKPKATGLFRQFCKQLYSLASSKASNMVQIISILDP